MPPRLPRLAAFFILACVLGTAHCVDSPPSAPQAPLPAGSDFVLTQPRFEERQGGRTLWKGHGTHAQGDIAHLAVQSLDLARIPQSANETPWTVSSPNADMDFEQGTGLFTPVRLVDASGHVITATTGHYHAADGSVDVTSPVTLTSPTLQAQAVSAHVDLRANCIDIQGPVEGALTHARHELGP